MKNIWLCLSALLLLLFLIKAAAPKNEPVNIFENWIFRADFESGSVGPWSSYPPAQDTAYDPTIWVKKVEGNPTLCLVREIDAWQPTEYLFGVRKKLDMYLVPESQLSFRFYVKSYGGAESIIVKLALGDNTTQEIRIPITKTMTWEEVVLPIAEKAVRQKPVKLEALAIMAFCHRADPEAKLRLAVDDILITGCREKKVQILEPELHPLEELGLGVTKDHILEGKRLRIASELPVSVKMAEVVLANGWEKTSLAGLKMRPVRGNLWQAETPPLTSGLYWAEVKGTTPQGATLASSFVFLVKPRSFSADHPFLLFTPADLAKIREAIEMGRTKAVWEKVCQQAADFRRQFNPADFRYNLDAYDEIFWLPTYEGYVRALHASSHFIRENAIVYAISGDKEAGQAVRQALLSVASWPSYVHPHILNQGQYTYWPVGLALIDLAMGYDMVYDLLSPQERKTIAAALFLKGVTQVFKEYVRDNRVSSNTSNWISHVTGGGILCALAISREYASAELEPYLSGMMVKLAEFIRSTFDPDGYYGEGYYYHNFSMQSLSHTLPALKNFFHIPYPEVVKNSFQYLLYQQDNETGRIYEFGDSHEDLIPSSMSHFAFVLSAGADPHLLWLYRQRPGNNYLDLIFPAPEGEGSSPTDLPLVKRLRMVGSTIFRSGFGPQDFVFIFKCGPFYNHQHFDQGSFFLADGGELFLGECGNSHYYEDPWYPRLYIQAGGHNCPLVDGNVESQLPGDFRHDVAAWQDYARITGFLDGEETSSLTTDLTPVYRGKWQSLHRNIIYLKPRTILLQDRGRGAVDARQMSLRFHAPQKEDICVQGKVANINRAGRVLTIRTLEPTSYQAKVIKRPMSLHEFKAENPITMRARGFLELSAEIQDGAAQFLNLLTTDVALLETVRLSPRENCLEVCVGERKIWVLASVANLLITEDYETDAEILAQMSPYLLLLSATFLKEKGEPLLRTDSPSNLRLRKEKSRLELDFSSLSARRIDIQTGWKPKRVRLQPGAKSSWKYEDGYVRLSLPWLEGKITIER